LLSAWIPQDAEDLRGWEWNYLWGQVQPDYAYRLREYPDSIRSLALSPNGTLLASSDWSGHVALWDLPTRTRLLTFREPSTVHRVQFLSDQVVVTAQANGTIALHSSEDGTVFGAVEAGAPVLAMALSPARDRLAVMTAPDLQESIKVWRLFPPAEPGAAPEIQPAFETPGVAAVRGWHGRGAIAFSPSGEELAAGYSDGTIHLLDAATGSPRRVLTGHVDAVAALAYSSDGRWLASAAVYADTKVRIWEAGSGA
jgi:WD40 repeat protein